MRDHPVVAPLTNKINAALLNLNHGNTNAALNQLSSNGLIGKVNGCAVQGGPDKNDWITSCADQRAVYLFLADAIALLE